MRTLSEDDRDEGSPEDSSEDDSEEAESLEPPLRHILCRGTGESVLEDPPGRTEED